VKALFARAGVDYDQWKAISRTLLRSDFRPPASQGSGTYSLGHVGGLLMMVVVYGLLGLTAAMIVLINRDVLLTGMVMLSYVAMMVTTALLSQHASSIVAAADYAILGPLPLSSRTFFAVRLTNILFHTALLTTLMGYPPVLAQIFARGVNVWRGMAAALALYAFTTAITFFVVLGYGSLLRFFGTARLERTLMYAQTVLGLLSYAGVVVVMQTVRQSSLTTFRLPRDAWLYFFPPAWYASYVEIADGRGDAAVWVRAALSVAFLGGMFWLLRGRLSTGYAERIGQLAAVSSLRASSPGPQSGPIHAFFKRDEARAVSLLVRAQFRHDMKVRLGILSIVPMTLLYMYVGGRDSTGDPFVERQIPGVDLTAMVVLLFPAVISQQLSWSDAFKASWIYFATPADRGSLIVATKNVIVAFFILPFVVFLAAVYAWMFGHVGHAIAHAVFLGLIAHLVLQAGILMVPRLPFATTQKKATSNMLFFVAMLLTFATANTILFVLQRWIYVDWTRVAVAMALLVAAAMALNVLLRARAAALLRHQAPELG
jgi:hypothetical protein